MSRSFSTSEAARILGVADSRVRRMVRSGLCQPARTGRHYAFSFRDLVVARAALGLLRADVPPRRVRTALSALRRQLPEERPLSGLRIWADGRRVAVRDGVAAWNPDTGQTVLAFDQEQVQEPLDDLGAPEPGPEVGLLHARREFERGLAREQDDPQEARVAYRLAIELDPELVDAYVNLGRLAHEGGDPGEAARLYHLALERDPGDPVIHFNLGLALEDTRGLPPAASHYEKALELDPTFADAHYNLAGLYRKLGRGSDALRHYLEYKKLTEV